MKNSIGSDSHAFVLEAINACRASSGGAAGPVPAVAAMMRLLLGQMIPQTFSIIRNAVSATDSDRISFVAGINFAAEAHR